MTNSPHEKRELVFLLDKKNVLSSNTYKSLHWAVKGKITDTLRSMSVEQGSQAHPASSLALLEARLDALSEVANQAVRKARRTKALQKEGGLDAKAIKKLVDEEFAEEEIPDPTYADLPRLFTTYKIRVTVAPPTRRRLDPVNLYPTVKAIIDGLTDAAWWDDDDFTHLVELSFVYGGLSGEKDAFRLTFEVDPVGSEELKSYVVKA